MGRSWYPHFDCFYGPISGSSPYFYVLSSFLSIMFIVFFSPLFLVLVLGIVSILGFFKLSARVLAGYKISA